MYDEALKEADVVDSARSCIYSYPKKILAILDLINDRDKTIEVCKAQFKKTDRKQVYFDRLQKEMTKEEWDAFIDDTIHDADEVFVHDYDDVEAQIHHKEEDSIFYYHSSEDRIVLSHALFWTMALPSLSWLQALVVICLKSWLIFS